MTRKLDDLGPEDLVAYLDGEVDPQTSEEIERRLAGDPQLVQRMREHQQAWDLLDELPREEGAAGFTETTLKMVAVAAADDAQAAARAERRRRSRRRLAAGASLVAATMLGYLLASARLARPERQLLRDLPVIENLDELQQAESVEFLRTLEHDGLFVAEVVDGSE